MRLVGFNFTKISGEKLKEKVEDLKIETKIDVKEVSEVKQTFFKTKEEMINIKFYYGLEFNPKLATLDFEGNMVLSLDSKKAKEIVKEWKNKKVNESFREPLFNIILQKCNVKALQIEESLNLPIHFRMPSVKVKQIDKK